MKQCPICKNITMVQIGKKDTLSSSAEMVGLGPGTARLDFEKPSSTTEYAIIEWKCLKCNHYEQEKVNRSPGSA